MKQESNKIILSNHFARETETKDTAARRGRQTCELKLYLCMKEKNIVKFIFKTRAHAGCGNVNL